MANMSIAKMHRRARKFVGWIAAAGVVIAYVLSLFTVMAGVEIYAWNLSIADKNARFVLLLAALFIGALFSLLIERMTLVQAAKVRNAREKREAITANYDKIVAKTGEDKTEEVERLEQLELARVKSGGAEALMLFGALVSTAAGTLFWHYILQGLPLWQAWGFSTLFSAVISFTLIESELHKNLQFAVISESIVAQNLIKEAGTEDARDRVMERFAGQHAAALESAMNAETFANAADASALQTLDEAYGGTGLISTYVDRERAYKQQMIEEEAQRTREQMRLIRGGTAEAGEKLAANAQERSPKATIRLTDVTGKDTGEIISPFHRGARR